jgi:hypothetical protein
MRIAVLLGFAASLAPAVTAQQTLVVDPGDAAAPFTTLGAALAVAGPGDTVLVRGGFHNSVIVGGPVQIVGDPAYPRPTISGVDVFGANGCVSLVRFHVTSMRITGDAALDDVTGLACTVNGGNVVLTGCTVSTETHVLGGNVVFNRCQLTGRNAFFLQSLFSCVSYVSLSGLEVLGGTVALANCTLTGGAAGTLCANVPGAAAAALVVNGGVVRVTRSHLASSGPPVVVAAGTLEHDPSTTFAGLGPLPGIVRFLPATDGAGALPGGAISVQLQTQPNLAALVVASVGFGSPTPSPFGELWFDPTAHVVLTLGTTGASGVLAATIAVPLAVQRGTALTLQGGAIAPVSGAATVALPIVVHVQ